MEQLGGRNRQGKSRHEKEKLTSGAGSRTLCDCVVTSRKVGHITTDRSFSIGSLVPFRRSKVEFRFRASCHTFVGEQFWGRAVRASRDPMDPGRFLFAVKSRSRGDAARRVFHTVGVGANPNFSDRYCLRIACRRSLASVAWEGR